MTHNLYTIYSPKGEMLEVSKPNFDDLRKHYGWTPQPPVGQVSERAIAAATVLKDSTDGEEGNAVPAAGAAEPAAVSPEGGEAESNTETTAETGGEEGAPEEVAATDEKAALIAELAEKYDFTADKRWNVAKLTIKRDELAAAAK